MNTPTVITPQAQRPDPEVLKAQLVAFDAQLTALEVSLTTTGQQNTSNRAAADAQNRAQYLMKRLNLTRQKAAVQEQIAKMAIPPA